ncbi:hypothetical protein [Fusobacterium animalis]|uniref:hypothetical protein n=1 Tax=Fusobacterium animalis TaxID=76859 RepID=UPI0030D318CC
MEELEIRILPMSEDEFCGYIEPDCITNIKDMQEIFFMQDLKLKRNGKFKIKESHFRTAVGSLILFQYRKHLIASAIYDKTFKIDENSDDYKNGYKEYYLFKPDTIRIFSPISEEEFQQIKEVKFQQAKHKIDYNKLKAVEKIIKNEKY